MTCCRRVDGGYDAGRDVRAVLWEQVKNGLVFHDGLTHLGMSSLLLHESVWPFACFWETFFSQFLRDEFRALHAMNKHRIELLFGFALRTLRSCIMKNKQCCGLLLIKKI